MLTGAACDRPSQRNGASSHVTQIKVETWASQSQCVREDDGVQEESKATEEGSGGVVGVIWSRLKPEQEGLVTKAYLWRRHSGSETVALWENLLQQTWERAEGKERWERDSGQGRGFGGGKRKPVGPMGCQTLLRFIQKCISPIRKQPKELKW